MVNNNPQNIIDDWNMHLYFFEKYRIDFFCISAVLQMLLKGEKHLKKKERMVTNDRKEIIGMA